MLSICMQNTLYYVYNVHDWEVLRCDYRIIGELLGNNFCIPSLPLRLLPEEVLLLSRRGIAKFIKFKQELNPLNINDDLYIDFKNNLLKEQRNVYEKIRKNEVQCLKEQIIYGKRKHGDARSKELIVAEELNKLVNINSDTMLWPIFCQDLETEELLVVCEQEVLSQITVSKFTIFNDLWEKGYYITPANKFGGDYLLYTGDPILHHSINIVHYIKDGDQNYNTTELVSISRLGTSVKKRTLLATVKDDRDVLYITLNWIDI